jgi:CPA2 family monovalent cation:H+ antiporter-2
VILFPALAADDFGLLADFAMTMAVAGAAVVLFRWVRLPPVLGYLLAGVLIGPFSVLPSINLGPFSLPDSPIKNVDTIHVLSDLGLVLLLFGIGLEMGWQRIRRVGFQVVIIAAVEMSVMFVVGYQIAYLLGWTVTERVFLGAALSISSSAILVKMLRDTGTLFHIQGRLIVGILVVEDFAAVILLTVLSGVSTTGAASLSDVGYLTLKLAIFAVCALVFGAIFAPKLVRLVSQFRTDETLLVASLALCFGLALAGQMLGLSAAAGAFLIGTVLGDTDSSEEIERIVRPVRDMFAAIFFVSIGMLMDLSHFMDFIIPALIISAVFIVGKVTADTVGTILSGHGGRTALKVGMGMPQLGEFSLAMTKLGVEQGVVGSFLNPVVTLATGISALLYPFIFRSADVVADRLDRHSPGLLKRYSEQMVLGLTTLQRAFRFNSPHSRRIQRSVRVILLNVGIIVVIIAVATGIIEFTAQLSALTRLQEGLVGLIIGGLTLALCIPPAWATLRSLRTLSDGIIEYMLSSQSRTSARWGRQNLHKVLRDSVIILMIILPPIWAIPLISRLLSVGALPAPAAILVLLGAAAVMILAAFQIHSILETTFSRTFLGLDDPHYGSDFDVHAAESDLSVPVTDETEPYYTDDEDAAEPGLDGRAADNDD